MFQGYITGIFMNFFDLLTRNIKEIFFITLAIVQLFFCGCVSVENSNYAALKKADLLIKPALLEKKDIKKFISVLNVPTVKKNFAFYFTDKISD